jgi:competence protein ComEC
VEENPLLRVALALIAGILMADALGAAVPLPLWLSLLAADVVALVVIARRHTVAQGVLLLVGVALVGGALTVHRARTLQFSCAQDDVGYEAVCLSEPQVRGRTLRMDLLVTQMGGTPLANPVKVKAALLRDTLTGRWTRLHVGDGLRAYSVMQPIETTAGTGHFNYARWLQGHGFQAQTFIYYTDWQPASVSLENVGRVDRMSLRLLRLRHELLGQFGTLGLSDDQLALVAAMTLGDRSRLSQQMKDDYSVGGVSHLLALSGLHLTIIYSVLTFLFSFGRRRRWLSQTLILMAVWTYVVLVGMSPSVVRAAVMLSVYGVCVVLGREGAPLNTLSFAACLLLMVNPYSLWDVGFQLSFVSVLSILVFLPGLHGLVNLRWRPLQSLYDVCCVSVAAQLGTAPLVAYYFGRFSCYFLLSNLVAVFLSTLILYLAVALVVASLWSPSQHLVAEAIAHLATWQNAFLSWVARLPGASVDGLQWSVAQVVVSYVLVVSVAVVLRRVWRARVLRSFDRFQKEQENLQKNLVR